MGKKPPSETDNQALYWFRRNAIQSDDELNTVGRMLMQMGLLQPFKMRAQTQAAGFGVSVDTARRARRIALMPFAYKGIEAPLFEKQGKAYVKFEVEGQSWNERFNACPYINLYFRLVTLRVDCASGAADGKAHGSARTFAEMIADKPKLISAALHDNEAKDKAIFEIESYAAGRHSYRPRLERVAKDYVKKAMPDKKKPDKQYARYILETQCDIHGGKAKSFIEAYVVPGQRLQLTGTYEKLVKAMARLYKDLAAKRLAAGNPPRGLGPGEIIKYYFEWIEKRTRNLTPSIKVLSITSGWFKQFRAKQSSLEQHDIITGEYVEPVEVTR
jgi:hypothetical protein